MKRITPVLLFISLALFACEKDEVIYTHLDGLWKMDLVQDKATGNTSTKPPSISGEVMVSFLSVSQYSGLINGESPTNTLTCHYQTSTGEAINISDLSMTEVVETSWGLQFIDHILSTHHYSLTENGKRLKIFTKDKVLFFERQ